MGKTWGVRKYNRRRFDQAAHACDTAVGHLLEIHSTLGPTHEKEQEMIQGLCVACDELKELILDAKHRF